MTYRTDRVVVYVSYILKAVLTELVATKGERYGAGATQRSLASPTFKHPTRSRVEKFF